MNKLRVVRQRLEIPKSDYGNKITLLHIIDYYKTKDSEWSTLATYIDDIENVSKCIARAINEYYCEDNYTISYDSVHGECEYCGDYSIDTVIITDNATGNEIGIIEDNHYGSDTRGWSDEEIIEDWKYLGYEVEIINC